jgi:hypothetical protein
MSAASRALSALLRFVYVHTVELSVDRLGHRCSGVGASAANGEVPDGFEYFDRGGPDRSVLRR